MTLAVASGRSSEGRWPAPGITVFSAPAISAARRSAISWKTRSAGGIVRKLKDGQEGLLRHLHPTDLLHALLAGLLLLEQLALAGDVAAVALGDHVLAHRLDRLAGDDLRADRRLDRHLELLARDLLAQPLGERAAGVV